jgi:hypothetical protein
MHKRAKGSTGVAANAIFCGEALVSVSDPAGSPAVNAKVIYLDTESGSMLGHVEVTNTILSTDTQQKLAAFIAGLERDYANYFFDSGAAGADVAESEGPPDDAVAAESKRGLGLGGI